MPTQTIKQIKLTDLKANPHNYRQTFSGPDFDSLVDSIHVKGVIQPILIRPVKGKKKYEIVFGARRFRAADKASKRKGGKNTIPAIVRELSDSEAYDLMIIENLQREDLSELEEAQGFKKYLDKNGAESITDLAGRIGTKPAFIRRRVSVLNLPEPILEAWGKGEIRYGYLEQLIRLDEESAIMEYFENIVEYEEITSVRELKQHIDNEAIKFEFALFDLKKAGCLGCSANSDVQLNMFDVDAEASQCLKRACFLEKQTAWLNDNWAKSKFKKKYKTPGFRFVDDVERHNVNCFHNKKMVSKGCCSCDGFVTIFSGPQMKVYFGQVCIGDSTCFKKQCAIANKKQAGEKGNDNTEGQGDQPRVQWHGDHFRQIFFKEQIPQRFEALKAKGLKVAQLQLFAMLKANYNLKDWFIEKYIRNGDDDSGYVPEADLFKPIREMSLEEADEALKTATMQSILFDDFMSDGRRIASEHIGIDLSKEWIFTAEYFQKKHIPEILGMGERFGVFADPKAKAYLADTIGKPDFSKCKKTELVDVFLKSGVDLTGMVPDEILKDD